MKYLNDVSYKDCVGKVCKSKLSGDFKILKYNNSENVEIQFINTGYETIATLGNIRNGYVKDLYLPSVFNVGVLGAKYPPSINGVKTKEHELWQNMLQRCYSTTLKKKHPAYKDCEVSDNFKCYEYFYEWCNKQIGFNNEGWHLDKDLLIKGNKVYSENTCVFLPLEINSLLLGNDKVRGNFPIGVSWHKASNKYCASVNEFNKQKHLGLFDNEIDAFRKYKQAKEYQIKNMAEIYKGLVDPRAYEALMNYQVEIDD